MELKVIRQARVEEFANGRDYKRGKFHTFVYLFELLLFSLCVCIGTHTHEGHPQVMEDGPTTLNFFLRPTTGPLKSEFERGS